MSLPQCEWLLFCVAAPALTIVSQFVVQVQDLRQPRPLCCLTTVAFVLIGATALM